MGRPGRRATTRHPTTAGRVLLPRGALTRGLCMLPVFHVSCLLLHRGHGGPPVGRYYDNSTPPGQTAWRAPPAGPPPSQSYGRWQPPPSQAWQGAGEGPAWGAHGGGYGDRSSYYPAAPAYRADAAGGAYQPSRQPPDQAHWATARPPPPAASRADAIRGDYQDRDRDGSAKRRRDEGADAAGGGGPGINNQNKFRTVSLARDAAGKSATSLARTPSALSSLRR